MAYATICTKLQLLRIDNWDVKLIGLRTLSDALLSEPLMATYRNRSIARGLHLLETLRDSRTGMGLTELAKRTELDLATAYRLLVVLTDSKYVHYDAKLRRYSLGYASFRLGQPDHLLRALRRMSQLFLKRAAVELGSTVLLGELHGTRWCICAEGKDPVSSPYGTKIGRYFDAHATAMGKMLLAYRPVHEVEALFEGHRLSKYTTSTIVNSDKLGREIRAAYTTGYATEFGEYIANVSAVAVPIVPPAGGVRFAISAATSDPLPSEVCDRWVKILMSTSQAISEYVIQP